MFMLFMLSLMQTCKQCSTIFRIDIMIPPPRVFFSTISQLQYVGIWILLFQGHPLISGVYMYTFIYQELIEGFITFW